MRKVVLAAFLFALALPAAAEGREPQKRSEENFLPEREVLMKGVPLATSFCASIYGVRAYGEAFFGHAVLCVIRDQPSMLISRKMKLLWI